MAHVLFVEDEENLRVAVGYTLRKDGHTVSVATSGPEAITSFPRLSPDLVLLDVMLPGCDGFAVLRSIRLTSSVPVIMLTARANEADRWLAWSWAPTTISSSPSVCASCRPG